MENHAHFKILYHTISLLFLPSSSPVFKYSINNNIITFTHSPLLQVTLTSTWKSIRKSIKEDSRFSKFSSSDRVSLVGFFFQVIPATLLLPWSCWEVSYTPSAIWYTIITVYVVHWPDDTISACLPSHQKREAEFNQYMEARIYASKEDFRHLLKETHFITHKWVLHMNSEPTLWRKILKIIQSQY